MVRIFSICFSLCLLLGGCAALPAAPALPAQALPEDCRIRFQLEVWEGEDLLSQRDFLLLQGAEGFYFSAGEREEYLFLKEAEGYGSYNREAPGGVFRRNDIPPLSQEAVAWFQREFLPLGLLLQDCGGLTAVRREQLLDREGTVYEGERDGDEVSCLIDSETGLALAFVRTCRSAEGPTVRYRLTCGQLDLGTFPLPEGQEEAGQGSPRPASVCEERAGFKPSLLTQENHKKAWVFLPLSSRISTWCLPSVKA